MKASQLVCGGISFHQAPIEILEKVAFRPEVIPATLPLLQTALGLEEVVLLSTCNRVEFFGRARDGARPGVEWPQFLKSHHGLCEPLESHSFFLEGTDTVRHLFELASGLQSMVIGETEIFGQVKSAYETSVQHQTSGKWLHKLFQASFSAAKAVRSKTSITRGSVSVGSVSVELSEKIFGNLKKRCALVLGAGDTSEKTARALQSRGVSQLLVSNRTFERAEALASQLQGRAVPWDRWMLEAIEADILISSTSAPDFVLNRSDAEKLMNARNGRPLFLIDLAVPRDFEPTINALDDLFLYNIDDLQKIAHRNLEERTAEAIRCREVLKPHVEKFIKWTEAQPIPSGHLTPQWNAT